MRASTIRTGFRFIAATAAAMLTFSVSSAASLSEPPEQTHLPGRHVSVNGARLWVEFEGTGAPLILIPGGPGSAHLNFHRWFSPLASSNQIVYFDPYGRGRSDRGTGPAGYRFARDVEDLEGLRRALGMARISLYGFSYGGLVAQAYAMRYPRRVDRLILANTFFSAEAWQAKNDRLAAATRDHYPEVHDRLVALRAFGLPSTDPQVREANTVPAGLMWFYNPENAALLRSEPGSFNLDVYRGIAGDDADARLGGDAASIDFAAGLQRIRMPVLLIGGRFDGIFPPVWLERFRRLIPHARVALFEKSGHYPQIEENERWAAVVGDFLAGDWP